MSRHELDSQPATILYVSPEPEKTRSVVHSLSSRDEFSFDTATTTAEALQLYNSQKAYDCIVSDHSLPDVDGLTLLETVRVQDPDQPFIIFTATGDESVASQAITANVSEYLVETSVTDQVEELANLILDAIDYHRDRARLTDQRIVLDGIFEATPHAMAIFQNDTFLKINQAGLNLLQVESRDGLATIDPVSILNSESGTFTRRTVKRLQEGKTFIDREKYSITATDGTVYPVELTGAQIHWGEKTAILLIARDISEEQQRKTKLNRFKQAIEHSGHAIYITDSEGTIEFVNSAFEDITGYAASEAIGQNPRILKSGEMDQAYYDRLWDVLTNGGTWEEEVVNRRKSGETYVAHQTIAPVTDADGAISAYVAIQIDVSDRKEEQTQLKLYRQAVQNASDLLAAADTNNRLLFANQRYRDFHGITDDVDLSNITLQELLGPERFGDIEEHVNDALHGRRVSYELSRENADGENRTLDIQYFPLRDVDGDIIGTVASMRDVTEHRKLMDDIRDLAEHRRVLSAVNNILMRANSPKTALQEVTDTIARSELFSCTFAAMIDEDEPRWVCTSESDLTDARVQSIHDDAFLDAVFESSVLVMDDVTAPPYNHHSSGVPSHVGIALALTHNDRKFGVLSVHLPPSASMEEVEIRLLSQLADDLGLFLYNQSLENDYRTFQEIAERIGDPIMLQNLDGEFKVINAAISEYAGLPKSELYNTDESAFMDEEAAQRVQDKKAQVLRTESPIEYEIMPEFPTKGERSFVTTRYPHYDDSGELDGTVAICRDVTELKEREKQMRVMDRVLRHNVNNDMNIIKGYAELIADEFVDTHAEDYAEPIVEHSERLLNLVEKERRITSTLSERPELKEFDLIPTLHSTLDSISDEYPSATLQSALPESCDVRATSELAHAVEELLRNGIEHADTEAPTIELAVTCSSTEATIEVTDSNAPIPEMEREVLRGSQDIEPLLHGSGLGLWLVSHIVRGANGRLEFNERTPTGNRVMIHLPTVQTNHSESN